MRSISSTELNLRDIRSLRYVDLKKVNFFVGHPVYWLDAHMIEVLIGESYNSFRIPRKEIEPTGQ